MLGHNLSHPSIRNTKRIMAQNFVWKRFKAKVGSGQINADCQAAKITQHNKDPLQTFQVPSQKFQHINVDLVGPLTSSHGYTYLFTIVDRFARWAEAFPLVESSTQACWLAHIHGWVSRFEVPADISSDRGAQYTPTSGLPWPIV